jgi:O-antigen ligase
MILSISLSSLNAFNWVESISSSIAFYPLFILFLALIKNLTISKINLFLQAVIFPSVIVSVLAIVEFITSWYGVFNVSFINRTTMVFHPRSTGVFDNSNTLAAYLTIILGLILGLILSDLKHLKKLVLVQNINKLLVWSRSYSYLLVISIACTQSRNGLIVTLVLILLGLIIVRKGKKFLLSLGLASIISFYLVKYLTLWRVINGLLQIQSENIMLSISALLGVDSRSIIWGYAISLFQKSPWLGWGLGNYKLLYPVQDISTPPHPHNLWLMLLAETGLIGFISVNLFVAFILYRGILALKSTTGNERVILNSSLISFAGTIIFQVFDCTFFDSRVNIISWLNLAIIYHVAVLYKFRV